MVTKSNENLRIVIIPEDNLNFSSYITVLNEIDDVEVYIVDNPQEALEKISRRDISAVVSGFNLSGLESGLEFLADVRRYDLVLPFFFLSNEQSQEIIASAFQAGANDFFVADNTADQMRLIIDAVRVSAEIAEMLRQKAETSQPSIFAEKYELVFDELREGTMMISAVDGSISFISDSLAEAIGRRAEDLSGKEINSFLTPHKEAIDDWHKIADSAEAPGGTGRSIIQLCFRHLNGSSKMFWTHVVTLELKGKPVLLCRCRDVTRFEKLEQEISAIRNQLRVIVENSADAIILCRDDGMIEFIGGAGPRMFGISPEDMSISTLDDIFGQRASDITKILRTMGKRSRVSGIENDITSRWGSRIPVHIAVTKLPSSDAITRYLLNIMDITQQKVMEAERLLITDLIDLMSTGLPATETLPKILKELRSKMMISFGLVVSILENESGYEIVAAENIRQETEIKAGQHLDPDFLPVEEEIWLNEGIVRNNLQEYGLYPLETLLYKEGVRSYISLPLLLNNRLVGAVHFGSHNAYALNRGHLTLFKQVATALASTTIRTQKDKTLDQMRRLLSLATCDSTNMQLFLSDEGKVVFANNTAAEFFKDSEEVEGRKFHLLLSDRFLGVPSPGEMLGADKETPLSLADDSGETHLLWAKHVSLKESGAASMIEVARK